MRTTIYKFLENYDDIVKAISKRGFYNAVMFKGFSAKEAQNLNILLEDNLALEKNVQPVTHRRLFLGEELRDLLNCEIVLKTTDEMDPYCRKKLNSDNSVELADVVATTKAMKHVFGDGWTFNPPVVLASPCSESPSAQIDEQIRSHSDSEDDWGHHPGVLSLLWTTNASQEVAEENESSNDLGERAVLIEELNKFFEAEMQKIPSHVDPDELLDELFNKLKKAYKENQFYNSVTSVSVK